MMIFADVSSGRSDFASASPTKLDTPGSGAAETGSIAAEPPSPVAPNDAVRTVTTIFGSVELDRLDRVSGVDWPLERLWPDDLGDVGHLHHVEERSDARQNVLGARGRGRDNGVVAVAQRHDQRRQRLGERVGVKRIVRHPHFGHARKLGGRFGGCAHPLPGNQNLDGLADLSGGGQRPRGEVAQLPAHDFRDNKNRHGQITPASSWSFDTSSATLFTFTPALRPPGSAVFKTLSRGATSTPKSAGVFSSIGFFFAFMMLGSEA